MNKLEHKRALGPWRSWALVVASVLGSTIFTMPSVLAPFGLLALVSCAAAGVGAIFIALMLANLARRVESVGGPFAYTHAGFGKFAGFLIAWGYWISLWASCAAIAVSFISYLGAIFPPIGSSPQSSAVAGLLIIWASVAINIIGVKEAGVVGLAATLLKLCPLIIIGVAGLFLIQPNVLPPLNPGTGSTWNLFASSFALTFWMFVGMEAITVPSEDVIDQRRNIPRALVLGTLTTIVIYLLVAFAVMGIIPPDKLQVSSAPLADVGEKIAGHWGAILISVTALVSTFGALNCVLLITGQTAMAAARAGVFPQRFERQSRYGTPSFSLIIAGVLTSTLMLLNFSKGLIGAYTFIILIATVTTVVPYAFCAISGLILQRRSGGETQRLSRESVIAGVAFLVSIWAIASAGQETVYWGFLLLIAGLPLYAMVSRNNESEAS